VKAPDERRPPESLDAPSEAEIARRKRMAREG
jgi:hypothetical protein